MMPDPWQGVPGPDNPIHTGIKFNSNGLPDLFSAAAKIFSEKKEELCEMDARMGDGDLGLTMSKGFGALPQFLKENEEPGNIGKTLMKSGMKLASFVPSTMGTLMASGIMEGGKRLNKAEELSATALADFWEGFADGIKKRGKCLPGDRTVLDAADGAARAAREALEKDPEASLEDIARAAKEGAAAGVEATKAMKPKFGKAAVHEAAAEGVADQGACACYYLADAMYGYISGK